MWQRNSVEISSPTKWLGDGDFNSSCQHLLYWKGQKKRTKVKVSPFMYLQKWMLFGDFWPWPWHLWLSLVFATKCRLRDCSPHQGHHYFPASSSWETWHFKNTVVGWRCLLFMKANSSFHPELVRVVGVLAPLHFTFRVYTFVDVFWMVCIFTWITFLNKTGCRLQTCLSSVDTHHQKQRQNFS